MKKLTALLLVIATLCVLAACGGSTEDVTVDLAAVKTQIISSLEISDPLDIPADRLYDLYTIDPETVKDSACFITMGGAFPDEIVMVQAVDAAAAKQIAQKLQNRLADVTNQAQNYDAESFALLEKCKVETAGTYVHLFISAKSAQMRTIFDNAKA